MGDGFEEDEMGSPWVYPDGERDGSHRLLPEKLPGCFYYFSEPKDSFGKGSWRRPVFYQQQSTNVTISINCYRKRTHPTAQEIEQMRRLPRQPFMLAVEPDYKYEAAEFHGLKAAAAGMEDERVFVFRDGDILFKFRASGGDADAREKAVRAAAEAVWTFRNANSPATSRPTTELNASRFAGRWSQPVDRCDPHGQPLCHDGR